MQHEVGEILYLLSNKNNKIVPCRVESVVTVKRIAGVDVTHEVSVPGHDEHVQLEKLNVKIYKSTAKLREHLLQVTTKQIDDEIADIGKAINSAWPEQTNQHQNQSPAEGQSTLEQELADFDVDAQVVELENGMKARVHIPKEMM